MKKIVFAFMCFLFIGAGVNAQDYNTGIGIRGGLSNGLTVKHFLSSNTAVEGLLSTRWHGLNITGLYEIHATAFDTPRLNWYYGIGGHIGFFDGDRSDHFDDGNYTVIGIDGIIGIEYNIEPIPFNISLDWKPGINLIGHSTHWFDEVAFSVRYIF